MSDASGQQRDRFNVEIKSRVDSLERVRQVAEQLATERLGEIHQVDTYFAGCRGRLKLREINDKLAELIWYERPDWSDAKTSRYQIVEIRDAAGLKTTLSAAYGIWRVVDKRREIFLYHNVRIHLDRVSGLGDFLEFEAVLNSRDEKTAGERQVTWLREQFGLQSDWLLRGSYSDML